MVCGPVVQIECGCVFVKGGWYGSLKENIAESLSLLIFLLSPQPGVAYSDRNSGSQL